jgi:hypothetical protein
MVVMEARYGAWCAMSGCVREQGSVPEGPTNMSRRPTRTTHTEAPMTTAARRAAAAALCAAALFACLQTTCGHYIPVLNNTWR